uniref:CAZy families GH23 protein n=1 Tax=uncultured Pseudomonas sp. TaxID=114707 RepID=A0A060BQM5_9PSED|nr:CAZy families GH23 protein [uncultured Pseudomonas sp.]
MTVDDIQNWNNLKTTKVKQGQTLTIYTKGSAEAAENVSSGHKNELSKDCVYKVKRGDNLGKNRQKNIKVTVADLQAWNKLSGAKVHAGQELLIRNNKSRKR